MRFIFAVALVAALLSTCALQCSGRSWLQNSGDNYRTGSNLEEYQLNVSTVNKENFGKLWSYAVDGSIHAQVLYVSQLDMGAPWGVRNVIYVVTMNDLAYCFDADSPQELWKRDFRDLPNGVVPVPIEDIVHTNVSNISDNIGIISTPYIDMSTGTIYMVAHLRAPKPGVAGKYLYWFNLHALDIKTGANKFGSPVVITATINGTGWGSVNGRLQFDSRLHNQRPGLTEVAGKIVLGFGSHNDWGAFHGWIMMYDKLTLKQTNVFCTSPDNAKGGVWQSGRPPAIDSAGNMYWMVGNGAADSPVFDPAQRLWTQAFLKFSTKNDQLEVVDFFINDNYILQSFTDSDIGSGNVLIVPGTDETVLIGGGKEFVFYVLNATNMGHYSNSHVLQRFPAGLSAIKGGGVYWDRKSAPPRMFIWTASSPVHAFLFDRSTRKFTTSPVDQGPFRAPAPGMMTLSANGDKSGTGIVWASIAKRDGEMGIVAGSLCAFNAENLSQVLWSSDWNPADDSGSWPKFAAPLVANGRVYQGTLTNFLHVYGVFPGGSRPTTAMPVMPVTTASLTTGNPFANTPFEPQALRQPVSVACQDSEVVLELRPYRWTVDSQLSFLTRAYFYNNEPMVPGPTIRMKAGTQCRITVVNNLDTNTSVSSCAYHHNGLHCPDTTNLHTHGLHVSPSQDNVNTHIMPGHRLTYTYDIEPDHLMGTFWYHAHHHGSVTLQVMGGLAGALIVEPHKAYALPPDVAPLYKQMERLLVLQHVSFGGDTVNTSVGFTMMDYPSVSYKYASAPEAYESLPPTPWFYTGNRDFYVVNGQFQPSISIQPDDVSLLKFVHAAATRFVELELVDPFGWCQWVVVARDGVFQPTPYHQALAIVLSSGNRADIAIKCSAAGAGQSVAVRSYANPVRDAALGDENRHEQAIMFTIDIKDSGLLKNPNFPTSQAPLPAYLADEMSADLSVGGRNVNQLLFSAGSGDLQTINLAPFPGVMAPFNSRYTERLCMGNVYEFNVLPPGAMGMSSMVMHSGAHPYHQHVNHFQVSSLNGLDPESVADIVRVGEWRDTVPAFASNGIKIRFRPKTYAGDMVLHCHILQHEDYGMMGLFEVAEAGSSDCVYVPPPPPPPPAPTGLGHSQSDPPTSIVDVDVHDNYFPGNVRIWTGQAVRWTLRGQTPHTVTSGDVQEDGNTPSGPGNDIFDSGHLGSGDTFQYTFWTPGEVKYYCAYHYGMTGTITVVQWVPTTAAPPVVTTAAPPLGNYYADFGGTGYLIMPGVPSTKNTPGVTISAWVRLNKENPTDRLLWYNGNAGGSGYGVSVLTNSRTVAVYVPPYAAVSIGYDLPLGNWTFVSVVLSAVESKATWLVYANAVQVGTATTTPPSMPATRFMLGGNGFEQHNTFDGAFDDLYVYNSARTPEQLLVDMVPYSYTPGDRNLVLYAPLDEGAGTMSWPAVGGNGKSLNVAGSIHWGARHYPGAATAGATTGGSVPTSVTGGASGTRDYYADLSSPGPFGTGFFSFQRGVATKQTTQVTMSAWVWLNKRPAGVDSAYDQIVMHNGSPNMNGQGWLVKASSGTTSLVGILNGGVGATWGTWELPVQTWCFVSVVSATPQSWGIYNGDQLVSSVVVTRNQVVPSSRLVVGGNSFNAMNNFNGRVDSALFWTVARTPAELLADSQPGFDGSTAGPNLAFWLPFSEGSGSVVTPRGPASKDNQVATNMVTVGTFAWGVRDRVPR